jgi:hypothetical protein
MVHLTGPPAETVGFATEMCSLVNETANHEIGLWNVQFGQPAGTMVYSTRVDSLVQLQSITDALMGSPKYHDMIAKGAKYQSGSAVDTLSDPLHGGEGDMPPVGAVVTVTEAVIEESYAKAVEWGIGVAAHAEKVMGSPVGFFMDAFGPFGGVRWIGGAPSLAEAEASQAALEADAGYLAMLEDAGDLFVPNTGNRSLATRVA